VDRGCGWGRGGGGISVDMVGGVGDVFSGETRAGTAFGVVGGSCSIVGNVRATSVTGLDGAEAVGVVLSSSCSSFRPADSSPDCFFFGSGRSIVLLLCNVWILATPAAFSPACTFRSLLRDMYDAHDSHHVLVCDL